ncbi:hypothetical protein RCL1_008134 [Eukaryota sp. TZLM3-RCL]
MTIFSGRKSSSRQAFCSWCFEKTTHYRIQLNLLRRTVFCCDNCERKTLPCRLCKTAHARSLGSYDEELCFKHKGLISDWDNLDLSKCSTIARCSWCRDLTEHKVAGSYPIVKSFVCTGPHCQSSTVHCSTPGCHSMAKSGKMFSKQCVVCSGEASSWEESIPTTSINCSWCISSSPHVNVDGSTLKCCSCSNLSSFCKSCKVASARTQGFKIFGSKCLACDSDLTWDQLISEVVPDLIAKDTIRSEVSRDIFQHRLSNNFVNKELQDLEGFKVPYVVLLSMSTMQRIQLGFSLGLSFVDLAKAESIGTCSALLCLKISSLSRESQEFLLPFLMGSPDWYKTINRCILLLFGKSHFKPPEGESLVTAADTIDSNSLMAIENEFLERLGKFQRGKFSREFLLEMESCIEEDAMKVLATKLQAQGYTNNAVRYITDSLSIAYKCSSSSGVVALTTATLFSLLNSVGGALTSLLPSAVSKTAASMIGLTIPVVSLVSVVLLSHDVIDLLVGSDISKCLPVVIQILLQKMILHANDVDLKHFL